MRMMQCAASMDAHSLSWLLAGARFTTSDGGSTVDAELRMREVGHSDRSVHGRYMHVLDAAHRAAAEQVAALVAQAGRA
jgi:hypothetical protein